MAIPTKFDMSKGQRKNPPASPKQNPSSVPSKVGRSIATAPAKQIPNTDKRQMEQPKGNTRLKVTTCYGDPSVVPNYDDMNESLGYKYSKPSEFQTTIDQSDRLTPWNAIQGFGLGDKDVASDNEKRQSWKRDWLS
jgi:hypothetical protein